MLHNVTYNITYVEYIRYPSIASIPKLVHHALRRCVETALPVAKSLELPIKVEPGICEILTVERWLVWISSGTGEDLP